MGRGDEAEEKRLDCGQNGTREKTDLNVCSKERGEEY
jgi:hypothetical protein